MALCELLRTSTCATMPHLAATAAGRRGSCRATIPRLFLGRSPLLATTQERLSLLEDVDNSLSPELPREQWLLYTDMLGCSMSRFSISVISTSELSPLAVKHGGGVKIQLSVKPIFLRIQYLDKPIGLSEPEDEWAGLGLAVSDSLSLLQLLEFVGVQWYACRTGLLHVVLSARVKTSLQLQIHQ